MKIGIETSALNEKFTGTTRYIHCLLEQLSSTDNEIQTFSPFTKTKKSPLKEYFNHNHMGLQKHLYRHYNLPEEMNKAAIECAFFPDYFLPMQFNKTSAIVIHDLSFLSHPQFYSKLFVSFYTWQLKETLKKKPVIITVSEKSREQIHELLSIRESEIFLIQAYSDLNRHYSDLFPREHKRPYLLYVGHVEPRKNLLFLIENFLTWKEKRGIDIELILAGETWIRSSSINKLLSKYNNHPDIRFTGYIEEKELCRLYANASGFVHTSFIEGFGFPVLEAMHYNLPILCTHGTATEEISKSGSIAIDPYNGLSLQKGLDLLYSNILYEPAINYNIKYSPEHTKTQLEAVLDIMEMKIYKITPHHSEHTFSLEEAVERTLLYASLFNCGIGRKLLHQSLLEYKIDERKLKLTLNNLVGENIVHIKDEVVYLNNNRDYLYKSNRENKKLLKSIRFLKFLNKMPLIYSISFSGGTAHYGIGHHDDIDLFIITKPNTIYIVYAFIHFISYIFRLRKEICANYLIDECAMTINSGKDFYTANQIISLVPYKNHSGYEEFLNKNKWIKYFYPNFKIKYIEAKAPSKLYLLAAPINVLIMTLYKSFYKMTISKCRNESVSLNTHSLKLHTNDNKQKILELFENEWDLYLEKKTSSAIQNKNFQTHPEMKNSGYTQRDLIFKKKLPA